ncbi:hypothetical protein [Arcanobacterium phocae]|uniref:hypothetical protein n=1 Tax=Arcanobacterium phocae TaxID=131112 RepID=UPI001C0EEE0C|nr:hypothetical protein [Arcanobacterium phocae]
MRGKKIKAMLATLALSCAKRFAGAMPAQAFTANGIATFNGIRYSVQAYSCNLYTTACSWKTSASVSRSMYFTHTSLVKANGWNVSLLITKSPGATISGNHTNLVTSQQYRYGRSSYNSGIARPSVFSVSASALSRVSGNGQTVLSGWTTW